MSKRWTKEEYSSRVNEICEDVEYILKGFSGPWLKCKTKLILECKKHSETWSTTSIEQFLYKNKGCPLCAKEKISSSLKKPDAELIGKLKATRKFHEGTEFKRTDTTINNLYVWTYVCPICSYDEYVEANLCDGIFKSTLSNLLTGRKSCRCGVKKTLTKPQMEYKIKELLEGSKYRFVQWENVHHCAIQDKVKLECEIHNVWVTPCAGILKGTRCPACAKPGYSQNKPGFIYILKIEGALQNFTGYGITNFPHRRMRKHKKMLKARGLSITTAEIFPVFGEIAPKIEAAIIEEFDVVDQGIEGFMKEATYFKNYENVVSFAKSLIFKGEGVKL